MKKRLQIILALVLTACLMAGMLPAAAAESAQELVDAPVITTSKTPVTGRFLKENGAVYVSEGTLLQMAPGIEVACSDGSYEIYIGRPVPYTDRPGFSWADFSIAADEVHDAEEGMFFPFSTVMEQLKLNPVVMEPGGHLPDYPQGCLLILEAGDMDRLEQLMLSIFEEPCYCMRYWKDSENYRTDVKLAELISALRDHRMFEFDAGQMTLNGYRDAFVKIIKLQDVKEVDFATGANETLGVLNTMFSVGESVTSFVLKRLHRSMPGSLKTTFETVSSTLDTFITINETFGVEEQVQLFAYAHAMRDAEDSIIRALKEIRTETPGVSSAMDQALNEALQVYGEDLPLWQQSVNRMSTTAASSVESLIMDSLPHSYLFDIGNSLTNLLFDSGNQLDATVNASRFLDIQTCCEQIFHEIWPYYEMSAREGKTRCLRILRDVTNLYLLAGVRAQEAMSAADGMQGVTGYCLQKLRAAQQQMKHYTDDDIQCYENGAVAADWLLSLEPAQTAAGNAVYYPTDGPLFITISWNDPVHGQPMDMAASLTGVCDDGTEIYRAPTEGEYTSRSGPVAGHYLCEDQIVLEIYRHDAVLDVEVMYGDVMPFGAPSYSDANVEIWFSDAQGNILAVIAANPDMSVYTGSPYLVHPEPFLLMGGTGVWYYSFRLDHGVLRSLFGEPAVFEESEWDEYDDEANGYGDDWAEDDWAEDDSDWDSGDEPGWVIIDGDAGTDDSGDPSDWYFPDENNWWEEPDDQPQWDESEDGYEDEPGWDEPDAAPDWEEPDYTPDWDEPASAPTHRTLVDLQNGGWLEEHYTPDNQLQTETRYNAAGYMLYSRWYDNGECTGYTLWDYDANGNLILIRYANAMEPEQVKLLFENTYSDGQLVNVQLYNILGNLLGEGPTAADAADAVGMRMMVEQAMPQ